MPNKERRNGDILILEKLGDIHTNLALNTQETKNTTDQLVKLNGKVAAHETRLQSMESNQALTSTALAQLQQTESKKDGTKNTYVEWFVKGLMGIGFLLLYYLLTHAGFPDFL